MVPKSAQGWPLIASSASGPCVVLRPASALDHRGEVAGGIGEGLVERDADAFWLGVSAAEAGEKAFWSGSARVRNTLLAS